MPVGPIGPIAGLPSPSAGNAPNDPLQNVAGLAASVMDGLQQAKERDKAQAQQQLPMLLQLAKAQPGNAQVKAALEKALKTLGLPLVTQQPQNASQTPNSGAISTASGIPGAGSTPSGQPAPVGVSGVAAPNMSAGPGPVQNQAPYAPGMAPQNIQAQIGQNVPQANMPVVQPGQPNLSAQVGVPQVQSSNTQADPTHPPPLHPEATPQQKTHHGLLTALATKLGLAPHPEIAQQNTNTQSDGSGDVDVNAYVPQSTPSGQDITEYLAMPQQTREAAAKARNQTLPQELLEAPQMIPPNSPQAFHVEQLVSQKLSQIAQGQETASGFLSFVNSNRQNIDAAMGLGAADALLEDPQTLQQLSAKTQAQIDNLHAVGVHLKNEDKVNLGKAQSVEDLQRAQTQLLNVKTRMLPLEDQNKWNYQQKMSDAAAARVNGYLSRVANLNARPASNRIDPQIAQTLALTRIYDQDSRSLQNQIEREQDFLQNQIDNAGLDPESADAKKIIQHISSLQKTQTQVQNQRDQFLSTFASGQVAIPGANPNSNFREQTPTYVSPVKLQAIPGIMHNKSTGQWYNPETKSIYDSTGKLVGTYKG